MLYGNKEKIEETTEVMKDQDNLFDIIDWQAHRINARLVYSVDN